MFVPIRVEVNVSLKPHNLELLTKIDVSKATTPDFPTNPVLIANPQILSESYVLVSGINTVGIGSK